MIILHEWAQIIPLVKDGADAEIVGCLIKMLLNRKQRVVVSRGGTFPDARLPAGAALGRRKSWLGTIATTALS